MLVRSIYFFQMHEAERSKGHAIDAIQRWYVASLVPRTFDLKKHFRERRSIAKARGRRRYLLEALARQMMPAASDAERAVPLSEPPLPSATGQDAQTTASHHREPEDTLLDPTVIPVLESSAREVEPRSPLFDSGTIAPRRYQIGRFARVSYWRSVIAGSTVVADHRDLDSVRTPRSRPIAQLELLPASDDRL